MFKTGSKFLLGLAAFGFVAAFWFGWATGPHGGQHRKIWFFTLPDMGALIGPITLGFKGHVGDHAGYAILLGLSITALAVGIMLTALRDADPEAVAEVAGTETVPEVPAPVTVNYWPVVGGFSLACLAIGLAFTKLLFVIGMIGLVATLVEWSVRAWSDRATGDAEVNKSIRDRFLGPVEVPAAAVLGIAVVVVLVSRILLALPKTGSYLVFGLVPAIILGFGALVVLKPKLSQSVIAAVLIVFALAILAGGVAAGIHGERKVEEKEGARSTEQPITFDAPAGLTIRGGR